MDAQNQTQVPLAAQGARKHSKRRFIIAAIIIAALIIAIVLALSSLGIIPGYLAIIISAFAVVFTLLPLIPTDDKNVTPESSPPQYVIPEIKPEIHIEVHTPVPSVMPAQQETSKSTQAWSVPYLRNPFFTGREELLKQLHINLTQNKAAALTQAQARPAESAQAQTISGLGGIGKTQTAVEYAYRYCGEYRSVLWVNAATRDELVTSFVGLATLLNLPEREEQDQTKIVVAVKHWFTTHGGWLLIVDNADDLAMVGDFLPAGGKGHLLLTTRAHAIGSIANGIEVEKLDTQQGMLLLLRRAKVLRHEASLDDAPLADRTAAEAIVQEMDGLPLALDQAGAFIEETECSVSDYLQRYRQRQDVLLNRRGGTGKDHPDPVSTTWSLSFERVDQLAAELLRCCAYLVPDAIPEQMVVDGASELGALLQPVAENTLLLDEALGTLLRFSLVQRKRDEHTFSIHRLVQAILKANIDTAKQRQYAENLVKAVDQAFPDVEDYRNWPRCQQYLPHAQVCVELIDTWEFTFPEAGWLLNQLGYYLEDRAQYSEAEPLYKRAIAIDEKALGPEHPGLATDLNNLALLYRTQGKYEEAEPLYERAIAIDEKTLGPEHPQLANHLNNLAMLYQTLGKYAKAKPLFKRALAIYEQKFGSTHPSTLTIRENYDSLIREMNMQKGLMRGVICMYWQYCSRVAQPLPTGDHESSPPSHPTARHLFLDNVPSVVQMRRDE